MKHWNEGAGPFEWSAAPDDILEKPSMLDREYKKLLAENLK